MRDFSQLLDALVYTRSRTAKLKLIGDYLKRTPDPDRGWALAALTGELDLPAVKAAAIRGLVEQRVDPVLFGMSWDYVGDLAETAALLWPKPEGQPPELDDGTLGIGAVVERLAALGRSEAPGALAGMLDHLDASGRFALLKLATGELRIGVSARLAKVALASAFGLDVDAVEEVWHGIDPPYRPIFAWAEGRAPQPSAEDVPVFRPFMLAHPLDDDARLSLDDYAAEWKWDGIRVQLAAAAGAVSLYSRGGDDVSGAFPDLVEAFTGLEAVADGELLVVRDGAVMPFNDLQQRLNRKSVTARMLEQYPAHLRLYDLLLADGEDLRPLSFIERRRRLESWHAAARPPRSDLSEIIDFESFDELNALWAGARARQLEGLMLKRKSSPYIPGRTRGHWYKWKRDPLTLDCVLMYAQRGSGKRSSYYSDYTFGLWRGDELVPVGKSYFGFTDEELMRLDRFIRSHTSERFGPVRAVEPRLVLEVAFDAVQPSTRHKSGLAMRFPRIHRIRWDKPAGEADRLEALEALVEK